MRRVAAFFLAAAVAGGAVMASAGPAAAQAVTGHDGWRLEAGTRVFFSGGRLQKRLFDPFVTAQENSRLTYGGTAAVTGELFARLDAPGGWFVKGYAGIGGHGGGILIDEDYPPAEMPYSNTHSRMRSGRIDYGSLDIGATVWRSAGARIGAFVGLHRFKEKYHGFGCWQVAANPGICAGAPYPVTLRVLSETARWTSLRLGIVGDFALTERLAVTGEVAFLPYSKLDAFDNHWLRPELGPMAEHGNGLGVQLETALSYRITETLSIGGGGRFWYLTTRSGKTQFPGPMPPSPESMSSERWGAFVQASYRTRF